MCFISFILFLNDRKPFKTPHTFLLMLDASNDNSWARTKSSSIKSYKLSEIPNSSISFRLIMIVTFKTSKSNQCPQDWFNTQAFSIKNKISTII